VTYVPKLIGFDSRILVNTLTRSVLVIGLGACMVCGSLADAIVVSEKTFRCILDWPKIRNTHINNADPEKLKEATRIFRDSVPNTEYPVGTILQLIPSEAMVKHAHGTFPKTNGWEFFSLDVSAAGTKISDRGDNVVNHSQGVTCLSCHEPAAQYDFVCEKGHGCAPIPLDDQQIAEMQGADPRCAKK
jgi:hypothetical protein